eukprot:515916_1
MYMSSYLMVLWSYSLFIISYGSEAWRNINPEECYLPKKTGSCRASFARYYYNSDTLECEQFNYGGCGGNKNNFKTLSECNKICGEHWPIPDCVKPGYTFKGDQQICKTMKFSCNEGYTPWYGDCGCGCAPDHYNGDGMGGCGGNDGAIMKCTIDPCRRAKCASYPNARCQMNNCGGCYGEFFDENGNKVDCDENDDDDKYVQHRYEKKRIFEYIDGLSSKTESGSSDSSLSSFLKKYDIRYRTKNSKSSSSSKSSINNNNELNEDEDDVDDVISASDAANIIEAPDIIILNPTSPFTQKYTFYGLVTMLIINFILIFYCCCYKQGQLKLSL